jgi:hypothetical protein
LLLKESIVEVEDSEFETVELFTIDLFMIAKISIVEVVFDAKIVNLSSVLRIALLFEQILSFGMMESVWLSH